MDKEKVSTTPGVANVIVTVPNTYAAIRNDAKGIAIGFIVAVVLLNALRWAFGIGMDATDRDSWNRSGMALRTDYGTGCQYLESSGGQLTPRIGNDGKQICTTP